jgi:hypothetical protein
LEGRADGRGDRRGEAGQVAFDQLVAEGGVLLDRVTEGRQAVGVHRHALGRPGRPGDPQPAGGRRGEADRAAEVVAVGHGARPAATAAAGPPLEPPVVRDRSQGLRVGPNRRLAGGEQAELGGVGLAERHQPGPPQLHDQLLVVATGTFCSYTPPEPTPWRVSQEEGPPGPR